MPVKGGEFKGDGFPSRKGDYKEFGPPSRKGRSFGFLQGREI
jgi:hypothetical protein